MIKNRSAVDKFAGAAQMIEAGANVRVFAKAPTFVLLVPAVYIQKIFFPHSHVTTDDPSLGHVTFDNGERESKCFGGAGELTCEEEAKTWNGFAHFD